LQVVCIRQLLAGTTPSPKSTSICQDILNSLNSRQKQHIKNLKFDTQTACLSVFAMRGDLDGAALQRAMYLDNFTECVFGLMTDDVYVSRLNDLAINLSSPGPTNKRLAAATFRQLTTKNPCLVQMLSISNMTLEKSALMFQTITLLLGWKHLDQSNRDKLHSSKWFFSTVERSYCAQYCTQGGCPDSVRFYIDMQVSFLFVYADSFLFV
jgi:hypothetical protein